MDQSVPDVDVKLEPELKHEAMELFPGSEGEATSTDLEGGDEGELIQGDAARGAQRAEDGEGIRHGGGAGEGEAPEEGGIVEEAGGGDAVEDGAGVGGVGDGGGRGDELADGEGEEIEANLDH